MLDSLVHAISSFPAICEMMSVLAISIFDPHAPHAGAIWNLFVMTLYVCTAIFLIVTGTVIYSLVKFRWREGERDPEQFAGHKTVEIIWTAIPLVIVIILFVLTVNAMQASDPPAPPEADIVFIGKQWWWEVRYPKSGVITANEIHIPVGKAVALRLEA